MSSNTYSVEFAKSSRGKCHKCKQVIQKGELRIVTTIPPSGNRDYDMEQKAHPACFNLPRHYATGAHKMTVGDFLDDVLQDASGGDILPSRREELLQAIESKPSKDNKEGDGAAGYLAQVKAAFDAAGEDDEDKPPAKKKAKKTKDDSSTIPVNDSTTLQAYGEIAKFKNDLLKDELQWNRQIKAGTKAFLLTKVLDGRVRGRLARCAVCNGGQLKLQQDAAAADGLTVACNGRFDEDLNMRIACSFKTSVMDAPRWQPWFTEQPSQEEEDEMDALIAEATGEEVVKKDADGNQVKGLSADETALVAAMEKKLGDGSDWNLTNKAGLRKASTDLLAAFRSVKEPAVDLPQDDVAAKQGIGKFLMAHNKNQNNDKEDKSSTSSVVHEIVLAVAHEYGLVQAKEKKAAKKQAAIQANIACPANAPIITALKELAELYFKEGNANAGSSYNRVVKALCELDYEITTDNAKGLGKGKTKVANIGKSSADKIHEFYQTGRIEKLEEKRALAGN